MAKTKRCGTCGQTKPVAAFHKRAASRDGLQNACKDCQRAAPGIDPERRRELNRKHQRPYQRALRQLRDAHRDEFEQYLAEQRAADDPQGRKKTSMAGTRSPMVRSAPSGSPGSLMPQESQRSSAKSTYP